MGRKGSLKVLDDSLGSSEENNGPILNLIMKRFSSLSAQSCKNGSFVHANGA